MQQELKEWAYDFNTYHLPRWAELPDMYFYKDQVIEYINKYVDIFAYEETKPITSSMINNYVKLGILSSPHKKKYSKNQVASLIVITILKQVTKIPLIKNAIDYQVSIKGDEIAYDLFCDEIENAIKDIPKMVDSEEIKWYDGITAENLAIKSVSKALAYKILTDKIVGLYS